MEIGFSWNSKEGTKTVIGDGIVNNNEVWQIKIENQPFSTFIKKTELDKEILFDTKNLEQYVKNMQLKKEQEEKEQQLKKAPLYQFLSTLPKILQTKSETTLKRNVKNNNRLIPLHSLIEEKVEQGATVTQEKEGLRLSTNDSFLSQSQVTKTGMDYATWLINQKQ